MNARTKAMKEKIQLQKRGTTNASPNKTNFTNTVSVEITPTNIIKVITSRGISPYEVEDQIKDLIYTGGILPNQKKINLSQFCNCCFDLLFNRQVINKAEGREDILETYFSTI